MVMTYDKLILFVAVVVGLLIGIIGSVVLIFRNVDAILAISTSDPEKDRYNFVILCPLDDIPKKKYLIVQVKENK